MKIIFEKIVLKNFLSFGSKTQEFKIENGINFITGINTKTGRRNGIGKSSLFEALVWGLYGKTIKNLSKSDVINWKNKKKCLVEIYFKIGEDSFVVQRGIKPNILSIKKNDKELDEESSVIVYQQLLEEEILKIDHKTFVSLFVCNPNNFVSIFDSPKPQKRALIESLFSLESFSQLSKKSHEKKTFYDKEKAILSTKVQNTRDRIQEYREEISSIKEKISNIYIDDSVEKELEKHLKETRERKYIDSEIKELLDKRQKYEKTLSRNKDIDNLFQKKIELYRYKESQIREEDSVLLKKIDRGIQLKEKELKDFPELSKIIEKISDEKSLLKGFQSDLKRLQSLDVSPKDEVCFLCDSILDPGVAHEKQVKKIEWLNTEIKKTEENIKKLQETKTQIEKGNSLLETLKKKRENLFVPDRDKERKKRYKTVLEKLQKIPENNSIENKNLELLIEDIQKNISILENETSREDILEKIQKEKLSQRAERKEVDSLEERKKIYNEKISLLKQELDETQKQKEKISSLLEYYVFIKNICKDEHIKQFAISSMLPILNKRINHYLSEAGIGFYVKINGWLEAEVKGPGITSASDKNLSGGEKKSLELATQFALFDVCKLRAKNTPNILVLDEILDSSVDSIGIENLLNIIRVKQAEEDSAVFIISHRKESSGFTPDRSYIIKIINGFSKLD